MFFRRKRTRDFRGRRCESDESPFHRFVLTTKGFERPVGWPNNTNFEILKSILDFRVANFEISRVWTEADEQPFEKSVRFPRSPELIERQISR